MDRKLSFITKLSIPCLLFAFFSLWIHFFLTYDALTLTVSTYGQEGDLWEVYYDSGKGYNPHEKISKRIPAVGNPNILEFKMPSKNIRSFRIDPGNGKQDVLIEQICIETSDEKRCWAPPDIAAHFQPLHDISGFGVIDDKLYLKPTGDDPFFSLQRKLASFLEIRTDPFTKRIYYLLAFLFSFLAFFVSIPIYSWFQKRKSSIEKIFRLSFLDPDPRGSAEEKKRVSDTIICFCIFVILFSYLSFWGLIKPPGQSPDEFAHFIKALSVPQNIWVMDSYSVAIRKEHYNPILGYSKIHTVPFHYKEKFSRDDYRKMKSLQWIDEEGTVETRTSAFSYPNLFYLIVFISSQLITRLFSLNPFDSFYVFRLVTGFYSSLLWVWVYLALKTIPAFGAYRNTLFWGVVLIPMLGFISSSINPDAFLIPLVNLFMIYSYHALVRGTHLIWVIAVFVLALFVKPAALVLFPALLLVTAVVIFFTHHKKTALKNVSFLTGTAFLISFPGFYCWSQPILHGNPVHLSLMGYLNQLIPKLSGYFVMYWGNLGWLDYSLSGTFYRILLGIILLNVVACLWNWKHFLSLQWPPYALLFSLVFCAGVVAGEYHYLGKAGYTLQGRYFLPVSIGLLVFLVHRTLLLRYIFVGYVILLNAALVHEHFIRYFGLKIENYLPFF